MGYVRMWARWGTVPRCLWGMGVGGRGVVLRCVERVCVEMGGAEMGCA